MGVACRVSGLLLTQSTPGTKKAWNCQVHIYIPDFIAAINVDRSKSTAEVFLCFLNLAVTTELDNKVCFVCIKFSVYFIAQMIKKFHGKFQSRFPRKTAVTVICYPVKNRNPNSNRVRISTEFLSGHLYTAITSSHLISTAHNLQ